VAFGRELHRQAVIQAVVQAGVALSLRWLLLLTQEELEGRRRRGEALFAIVRSPGRKLSQSGCPQ